MRRNELFSDPLPLGIISISRRSSASQKSMWMTGTPGPHDVCAFLRLIGCTTLERSGCSRVARSQPARIARSEEHTSKTPVTNAHLVCRLLLEKKNTHKQNTSHNNSLSPQLHTQL